MILAIIVSPLINSICTLRISKPPATGTYGKKFFSQASNWFRLDMSMIRSLMRLFRRQLHVSLVHILQMHDNGIKVKFVPLKFGGVQ